MNLKNFKRDPWFKEKLKEWGKEDLKAKKFRKNSADWGYIKDTPERVKKALELYIETGDLLRAARKYSIPYAEFNSYRIKAKIPLII